jgi:hypothetical protein
MAITINSPIAGKSYGTLAAARAYVARYKVLTAFDEAYLAALYDLCQQIGLRFEIAFAQWCDETDIGRSAIWLRYGNPAGIGALPDGTYVGITYLTGLDAARGHLIHLWAYAKGSQLPAALRDHVALDPRWQAVHNAGYVGKAPTLKGLANTWATNPSYAVQIASHANAAFSNLPEGEQPMPEQITYGRVPHPDYVDKYIPAFAGQAAGYYGQRFNYGVVWHRMVGNLIGTDGHFRQPGTGLTDYGIGVGGHDAASLDGVIYRWNDPLGNRSGWANGRILQPWGDGKAFLAEYVPQYGADIANRGQISIEISGYYGTPLTPKARAAIVAITAYWADQAGIPWHVFPEWPGHGYSFVRYHQEITGPAEKVCPGEVVIAETATLIAMTAERMRQYQTASQPQPTPLYAAPAVPAWMVADLASGVMRDHKLGSTMAYGAERIVTAIRDTPRRQVASLTTDRYVGPPIKKGESFTISHIIAGSKWALTPAGTRIYLPDVSPEIIVRPRAA